ncbi:FAD-dependent oxidoreductase [Nonomuraea indica]|uniref:FAD-dependent oxidoreductase n=1 Tax=Nonomuraea indica TaxID=1581193 RepID=A0ABW8A6S6_9ACTN
MTGDIQVDVAVVGGGIAGLSTAWELVRTGRSVAVLEADRVAAGVTGYTTAKLTALHTLIYTQLAASAGAEAARLYAQSQQDAIEHVRRTAAEAGIDCEWERRAAYTYVESAGEVEKIEAEAQAAAAAGLPASFVTDTGLPYPVAGAVRVEDQAQFHPRRYLLALAEAIVAGGGAVYERTRVLGLDEGEPCRLTTESGFTITATDVVVATHYPVFDRALLFSRLVPHRELVVAAVIPADRDPGGMYITQADNTRSVRTAPYADGQRLLIVTGESFTPGADEVSARYDRLADWTRQRFGVEQIVYRWAAQDNHTTDKIPYVGRLHPGAEHTYVATGYGGWGMSNGVMSGRLLAALIDGRPLPWTDLYDPRRLHPLREAGPFLKAQAKVAGHFVGDRLRRSRADSVDDIAPGTAAVVRVGGERCAVYRDEAGSLHALSAICTHLGCVVAFNDAERTWECPCHGSRFAIDGSVLQGPANHPLQPRHQ